MLASRLCQWPAWNSTAFLSLISLPVILKVVSPLSSKPFNKKDEQLQTLKSRRLLRRAESLTEWRDAPLVTALARGDIFLTDEISLADDSVLERINSVLEPERCLVLAEKVGWGGDDVQVIAASGFELVATMHPGGDYGKRSCHPRCGIVSRKFGFSGSL